MSRFAQAVWANAQIVQGAFQLVGVNGINEAALVGDADYALLLAHNHGHRVCFLGYANSRAVAQANGSNWAMRALPPAR